MIYTCNVCHFTFERVGEVDQCPDCGKKNIREANAAEKAEYLEYKEQKEKGIVEWKQFWGAVKNGIPFYLLFKKPYVRLAPNSKKELIKWQL